MKREWANVKIELLGTNLTTVEDTLDIRASAMQIDALPDMELYKLITGVLSSFVRGYYLNFSLSWEMAIATVTVANEEKLRNYLQQGRLNIYPNSVEYPSLKYRVISDTAISGITVRDRAIMPTLSIQCRTATRLSAIPDFMRTING